MKIILMLLCPFVLFGCGDDTSMSPTTIHDLSTWSVPAAQFNTDMGSSSGGGEPGGGFLPCQTASCNDPLYKFREAVDPSISGK